MLSNSDFRPVIQAAEAYMAELKKLPPSLLAVLFLEGEDFTLEFERLTDSDVRMLQPAIVALSELWTSWEDFRA